MLAKTIVVGASYYFLLYLQCWSLLVEAVVGQSADCFDGEAVTVDVFNTTDAGGLTDTLLCSTSSELRVNWYGNIPVSRTLAVGTGNVLDIAGFEHAGITSGGGSALRLVAITGGATLRLKNISLHGGWAFDGSGGAIFANDTSNVILEDCSFDDNGAAKYGGESHQTSRRPVVEWARSACGTYGNVEVGPPKMSLILCTRPALGVLFFTT